MNKCKCGHEEVEHVQTSIGRRLNCVICNKCDIYRPDLDAKQKKFSKSTVQYEHGKIPKDNELMEIKQDRPHCKKHGALLRYQNNIWKCINCGWSVEWVRTEKPPSASKEKDEFEKLIKTITEDAYDWCNGSFDKKPDDYIFRLSITEAKPKLKAQILKDNPLAGLSDEQVELVKCSMESHSHWRTSKDMFDVRNLCIMILKKRKED